VHCRSGCRGRAAALAELPLLLPFAFLLSLNTDRQREEWPWVPEVKLAAQEVGWL
jgi:hypothetical protein